jgi:tyrosine-protein phosphatase YwqE
MANIEKEQIRRVFPNNGILIKINPNNPPTESSLSSAEWQVITKIDGKKSLRNIIDILKIEEDRGLEIFYKLHQKDLIQIVAEQKIEEEIASEKFFEKLEEVLVKIIGPVAVYVINDVLWELNETREKYLKDKIPLLIESISGEILDDNKRMLFQKEMLSLIKTYEIS